MRKEEFIETLYINNVKVDVGMDDYGQCYFFEYTDENGTTCQCGCGTYNSNYLEEIYYAIDPYNTNVSIYGINEFKADTENMYRRYLKAKETETKDKYITYNESWYKDVIKPRMDFIEKGEFIHYDFDKMYEERYNKQK